MGREGNIREGKKRKRKKEKRNISKVVKRGDEN